MICPNCKKGKIKALIHIQMSIDANDNYHLNKQVIRKRTTEIMSQSHEKTSYQCTDCGWFWFERRDEE